MFNRLLSRRRFNGLFGGVGFALVPALIARRAQAAAGTDAEAKPAVRTVTFPGGTTVPAVGQGSWHLGQGRHPAAVEEEALRTGSSVGMTLIDTSGNYGSGRSEELIGRVRRPNARAVPVSYRSKVFGRPHEPFAQGASERAGPFLVSASMAGLGPTIFQHIQARVRRARADRNVNSFQLTRFQFLQSWPLSRR